VVCCQRYYFQLHRRGRRRGGGLRPAHLGFYHWRVGAAIAAADVGAAEALVGTREQGAGIASKATKASKGNLIY
jgi:hypothetical protein